MANVIKHKRGSGSDPGASDLVVGEVAIRTDVGKLFTKMDSGSVAEIADGGSDIAINTLSSSSATGGGSATFNGSAYRFTLSSPPSVSAYQLLVSINGVIQKPVAGTGQPSEGFSVDGTDIILGDAPATGADFFILTFKSLGVSEPADDSVTSAKIVDGAIVNADINASAAIAGSKIDPDFGSQGITTTGVISMGNGLTLTGTNPFIDIIDSNNNSDFTIKNDNGTFEIEDKTNSNATRLAIPSNGGVGIGITSVSRTPLHVHEPTSATANIHLTNSTTGSGSTNGLTFFHDGSTSAGIFLRENLPLRFGTNNTDRMRIDSSGNIHKGSTGSSFDANGDDFTITNSSHGGITIITGTSSDGVLRFGDGMSGTAQYQGFINYKHADNAFVFGTSATERMRIDSSGNLLIGTTSTGYYSNNLVLAAGNAGGMTIAASSTSDTNFINFADAANSGGYLMGGILYQHSTNVLAFRANNAERMRIDSSGNVGIGTTSPDQTLHVHKGSAGSISSTANSVLTLENSTDAILQFLSPNNTNQQLRFGDPQDTGAGYINYSHANNVLSFGTNGPEKMRIDSSGNVTVKTGHLNLENATATNSRTYSITNAAGTTGWTFGNGVTASSHQFVIYDNTAGAERMRLDSSGNVGIGTTSPSAKIHVDNGGSGNVAFLKHASSGIAVTLKLQNNRATGSIAGEQISFCDDTGTQRGKITNTTATTTYHTSSDYRLKENEVLISDGIERIKQLKPYKFSWKHIPNKIVDGFFAHEVENLVEDCVDGIKDRVVTKEDHDKGDYLDKEIGTEIHQMIDHSKLVPLLVAALQEAIGRIEALEAA